MGKTVPLSLAELMGTDDNSREANSQKAEIERMEKALSEFSSANFPQAYQGFIDLFHQTQNQERSLGYKYMADYTKSLLDSGSPRLGWQRSFGCEMAEYT